MSGARTLWVVGVAVPAVAAAMALRAFHGRLPDAIQPFPFNHRVHVAAKVECLACHAGVVDADEDRVPKLAKCLSCHPEGSDDKPDKRLLRTLAASGKPVVWTPLTRVPDHVFFSHARHVDVAGLECLDCHDDIPNVTSPPLFLTSMSMDRCIACHEKHADNPAALRATRVNCADCHR